MNSQSHLPGEMVTNRKGNNTQAWAEQSQDAAPAPWWLVLGGFYPEQWDLLPHCSKNACTGDFSPCSLPRQLIMWLGESLSAPLGMGALICPGLGWRGSAR